MGVGTSYPRLVRASRTFGSMPRLANVSASLSFMRDKRSQMRDFRSDNTQGCSPEVLEAIARAARGTMASYGDDEITGRVRAQCRDIFETDVEVFPVITGTAGNALALASMRPKTIVCHEDA